MATDVAQRTTVPAVTALPPTTGVRFRSTAVTWSWRGFLAIVYLILFGPLVILMLSSINDSNVLAFPLAASAIFAFTWSVNNYVISAFTIGFQQTFPVWVCSSVRNPDHTAIVNSISTVISIVQVVLLTIALLFLRSRSGEDATRGMIAGGEAVAASAKT